MNQDQPLRRLLDELQAADAERQREARDTPAYADAVHRVDRLMEAVWKEAGGRPPPEHQSARRAAGRFNGSVTAGSPAVP